MNRPFPAFAALLALLALAMFAVSSSSRSTTVQAPRSAPAQSTFPRGQSNYVIVVPAAEEPASSEFLTAQLPPTKLDCVAAPVAEFKFTRVNSTLLSPTQVAVAEAIAVLDVSRSDSENAAHGGSDEEEAAPEDLRSDEGQSLQGLGDLPLTDAEVLAIFQEFAHGKNRASEPPGGALWQQVSRFTQSQLSNPLAALKAWIHYYLYSWVHDLSSLKCEPAISTGGIGWSDYDDLMSQALLDEGSPPSPATEIWDFEQVVRFGDDLWRSAAAAWHQTLKGAGTAGTTQPFLKFTAVP